MTTIAATTKFKYPRFVIRRKILQFMSRIAFSVLTDFTVIGKENLPKEGPLIVVANHFGFVDPVAFVATFPWPMDFIGGFVNPGAPPIVKIFPNMWGYYPVFRGTGSTYALKAAEAVLKQKGVLGVMPEGGSWAAVLRPPRPGTAYLTARTGAPLLPVGLIGFTDVFPLKLGRRAKVTVNIGKPFGPFKVTTRGRERREQLDEIGHTIMKKIAELIPPEQHGCYSDDPAIREAAKGTEIWPWADAVETDFEMGEQLRG